MRRWQTWLVAGVLCFAGSSAVQAQNLFERLGQVLTPETPPLTAPSTAETAPEARIPETLPAPPAVTQAFGRRPTLGVTVEPLTDDIVRQRRLPVRSGAVITAIVEGSPADQAGLPLGGVIVALDGRRIDSPADLVAAISAAPTDREVELSYYEGDRLYRKRVHLLGTAAAQATPNAPAPVRRDPLPPQRGVPLWNSSSAVKGNVRFSVASGNYSTDWCPPLPALHRWLSQCLNRARMRCFASKLACCNKSLKLSARD